MTRSKKIRNIKCLINLRLTSQLEKSIQSVNQETAPASQWKAMIAKLHIKQEELEWVGLNAWLDTQGGKVSKQDILDFVRTNNVQIEEVVKEGDGYKEGDRLSNALSDSGVTKFSQYQEPGGENYKELLLTMPNTKSGTYNSQHFKEPNILAHVRFNERTGPNGEKMLFLEELQSDWHQAGRKKGYKDPHLKARSFAAWLKENGHKISDTERKRQFEEWQNSLKPGYSKGAPELVSAWAAEQKAVLDNSIAVPGAPFKKSWPLLAFKRMVRYAAENGFDAVVWTPGEIQAARYDLSKQVDSVEGYNFKDGTYKIVSILNGERVLDKRLKNKIELENVIGKDLAEKIINQRNQMESYSGTDLKVGGEGMKGFYDKILPSEVNKFFGKKAWGGAKVGTVKMPTTNTYMQDTFKNARIEKPPSGLFGVFATNKKTGKEIATGSYETIEDARHYADLINYGEVKEGWSLPITSEMKSKALREGMPMFNAIFDKSHPNPTNQSGKVGTSPSIENHPLKQEIQYSITRLKTGATTATPDRGTLSEVKAAIKDRFGKGYSDPDMKLYERILGTPYLLGKKFKALGRAVGIEIGAAEDRAEFLHSLWDGGLSKAMKAVSNVKAHAKQLQDLVWRYDNRAITGVTKSWFRINGNNIELNPGHYDQVESALSQQGYAGPVIDAFIQIRKSLDKVFIDVDNTMQGQDHITQNDIQEYRSKINKITNYFPHKREGDSFIIVREAGKKKVLYREHYNSGVLGRTKGEYQKVRRRAEAWANENLPHGTDIEIESGKVEKLPDEAFFGIDTDNMQQVIEAAIDKANVGGVAAQANLSKAVADILKGRGWAQHSINRQNIPGFKKTDIWGTLHEYFGGYAGFKTKMQRAQKHHGNLKTIDAKKNKNEYSYTHKYVRDMLANSDDLDRAVDKIRGLMFVKYLGVAPKSAFVNLTQNIVMAAPVLSQHTQGIFGAEKALGKAMIDVRKALTSIAAWTKGKIEYDNLTEDEQRAIRELHESGSTTDQFLRDLQGDLPGAGWSKYAKKAIEWSGIFMGVAEKFNRISTGLAAYRVGLEKYGGDLNGEALHKRAVEFAKEIILDSHFLYGKSNLPEAMRGGAIQKVARSGYTFRAFTHNYLHTMKHLLLNQGKEGRKAFARGLRNLFMVGGLTSIPFFKAFSDIFDGDDDDDDLMTNIRAAAPETWMKDLLTYGLPGMAGVDLSGSLSIELPRSWEDIIGVPYSVPKDSFNFFANIKAGNTYRAVAESPLTPMALRNPLRGIELYTQGQRTRGGRDINYPGKVGPRKITGVEAFGKSLGFQPISNSKSYSAYQATQKMKEAIQEKKRSFADRYVNAYRRKDLIEMAKIRKEINEYNAKARKDKKPYKIINIKQMVRNRMRTGGYHGIPKKLRREAKQISNVWR